MLIPLAVVQGKAVSSGGALAYLARPTGATRASGKQLLENVVPAVDRLVGDGRREHGGGKAAALGDQLRRQWRDIGAGRQVVRLLENLLALLRSHEFDEQQAG